MMAALLCLNGLLARMQARRVTAHQSAHPPVFAGETATIRVTATNNGSRPATVSVEERHRGEITAWFIDRLPAGKSVTCSTSRVNRTRGRFSSSVWISSGFPLGLIRHDRKVESGSDVIVLPEVGEVDAVALSHWLLRQAGGDGRARKVLRRVTTDQADVRGVRPFRPGDPIRGIHWRSSARRGELMVREYDAAPSPDLVLVLEPWLPKDPTPVEVANLEAALTLAATVAWSWRREFSTRVTIAIAGDPDSVQTAGATDAAMREALAPLADVTGSRRFDPLGPRSFDRTFQRAARLVVSSRRDSPYATALTRSTGRLFLAVSPGANPGWYVPPASMGTRTH
jgi:uncharacterized protein (DUF58 family)